METIAFLDNSGFGHLLNTLNVNVAKTLCLDVMGYLNVNMSWSNISTGISFFIQILFILLIGKQVFVFKAT